MATLHDFFVSEVTDHLERFETALDAEEPALEELHRSSRAIRGASQIAREDAAHRGARALENATRAMLSGSLELDHLNVDRLRASAEDLRAIARGADAAARADAIVARWDEVGIDAKVHAARQPAAQETRAFLEYAAHEVAAIASELDRSIGALADDGMDREPLKAVLRRQRGLLGSARLEEIPVLAESLRAVEDLTSIIGKLDVAVRHEWLDVFRCARDVLVAAAPLLETGRQPEVTNALRRLRVLRHELLERHGIGESVSAVHDDGGLSQPQIQDELVLDEVVAAGHEVGDATPADPIPVIELAPDGSADETVAAQDALPRSFVFAAAKSDAPATPEAEPAAVAPADDTTLPGVASAPAATEPGPVPAEGVDVRELQYRGERALQRAAELRPVLERMLADTRGGREALAELYDLLRLARE